jgi:hypothetical protein
MQTRKHPQGQTRQRSSVLKTPLSYSPYSTHGTHDTHDTRSTHITHSALLFLLFLNRVLLFGRDRPMQSFYRGVVGELIERWRALLHPMAGPVKPYWLPHRPMMC